MLNQWLLLGSYGRSRRILVLFDLLDLEVKLVDLLSGFCDQDVHLLDRVVLVWVLRFLRSVRTAAGADF